MITFDDFKADGKLPVYQQILDYIKRGAVAGTIADGDELLIAMQTYHYNNFNEFFNVDIAEVKANMKPRVVATSINNLIEEYFSTHQTLDAHVEGRIEIVE